MSLQRLQTWNRSSIVTIWLVCRIRIGRFPVADELQFNGLVKMNIVGLLNGSVLPIRAWIDVIRTHHVRISIDIESFRIDWYNWSNSIDPVAVCNIVYRIFRFLIRFVLMINEEIAIKFWFLSLWHWPTSWRLSSYSSYSSYSSHSHWMHIVRVSPFRWMPHVTWSLSVHNELLMDCFVPIISTSIGNM